MVFIHGESYNWGSGNLYDGRVLIITIFTIIITVIMITDTSVCSSSLHDHQDHCVHEKNDLQVLASRGGLIVITLNYRLGILGESLMSILVPHHTAVKEVFKKI